MSTQFVMRILIIAILLLLPVKAEPLTNIPKSPAIEKALELVNSKKPADALKILSACTPSAADLSLYHYAYARAYDLSGKHLDSLAHFRLAYIYSRGNDMKELTLFERSEAYFRMQYYPEAAMSFKQFLRDFPNSPHAENAHMELADSLYHQGLFNEALLNYEISGSSTKAVYGRANAYQAMGRLNEAYGLYVSVLGKDREYAGLSPETTYRIAETFRLMGKSSDAKIYYNSIRDPFFKSKADIGLGLIAVEESQFDSARKYFNSALQTSDRGLRREALLHLAEVCSRAGGQEEAKSRLIEIRNKYPYGKEYDAALLMLSRIYKKEGKLNEAVSLMKELASRRYLDRDTVDELEKMMLDAKKEDAGEFLKLWDSFGHFFMDPQRSKFLLEAAEGLKSSGRPFVDLCTWLIRNGSFDVKSQCSLMLANFYADMGDADKAFGLIKGIKGKGNKDDVLRVKARIYRENREYQKAMNAVFSIKEMKPEDVLFFADLLEPAKNVKKAVKFCEKSLKTTGAPLKVYIKLADALYKMGKESDALKFYKIVASLKPENRKDLTQDDIGWTYYMVLKLSHGENPTGLPGSVQKGNSVFSRSAEASLKEADILERIKRVF